MALNLRLRVGVILRDLALRACLTHCLGEMPQVTVCWQGSALTDIPDMTPVDIVLLGVEDATVASVTATLRRELAVAVLLIAPESQQQSAWIFEAMGQGAIDVVRLQAADRDRRAQNQQVLHDKMATLVRLLGRPAHPLQPLTAAPVAPVPSFPLLAIGASTGGPAAVASLLQGVPRSYPAALVLIQHLNAEFAESLMQWLGQQLSLPVRLARQGQPPEAGVLLLAATQDHLCLGLDGLLHYITEPKDYPYRPSVDVFFHSVAQHWRGVAAGVLLTGMGRDGAQGLLAMRQRGFLTLAQNQASCVVYGMPKAAVEAGAVTRLGDLTQLNLNIQQLFTDTAPYLPPTNVDKPQ